MAMVSALFVPGLSGAVDVELGGLAGQEDMSGSLRADEMDAANGGLLYHHDAHIQTPPINDLSPALHGKHH